MFERGSKFDVWFYGALAAFYMLMAVLYGASGRWGWALAWTVATVLCGWAAHEHRQTNLELTAINEELTAELDRLFEGTER